jgi:hypothetical protein
VQIHYLLDKRPCAIIIQTISGNFQVKLFFKRGRLLLKIGLVFMKLDLVSGTSSVNNESLLVDGDQKDSRESRFSIIISDNVGDKE